MLEKEFYQRHVRKMEATLHLARIENGIGSGFPDISAAGGGKQFLIETKVSKFHTGFDTLFFEKFQIPFAMKRLRYVGDKGMFCLALCSLETAVNVYHMQQIISAPRLVYMKWTTVRVSDLGKPLLSIEKPFSAMAFNAMAELMIHNS